MSAVVQLKPQALTPRYDAMCAAIEAAHQVDEAKDIRDKAAALEEYARQARNDENERWAREIRVRAERRCGELLTERQMATGGDYGGRTKIDGRRERQANPPATLSDLGITRDQSSQWQKLAAVPEPEFEAAVTDPAWMPSAKGIVERHEAAERPLPATDAVSADALWLWDTLQYFERRGLLERPPEDVMSTMFEHMDETVRRLAPRVAEWLGRIVS